MPLALEAYALIGDQELLSEQEKNDLVEYLKSL